MATRQPFTWLVVETAPDRNGRPTVLLARAVYDAQADLLIVTGPGGQRDATPVGGQPLQRLGKLILCQMFQKEQMDS